MEARVNVNENDVVNVKVGDAARISVDAYPDRKIRGVVREIASTAPTRNAGTQEEVTNFVVKITHPRPLGAAPPRHERHGRHRDRHGAERGGGADPERHGPQHGQQALPRGAGEAERDRSGRSDKSDNRADVTNETQQKQKERAQRDEAAARRLRQERRRR